MIHTAQRVKLIIRARVQGAQSFGTIYATLALIIIIVVWAKYSSRRTVFIRSSGYHVLIESAQSQSTLSFSSISGTSTSVAVTKLERFSRFTVIL